MGIPTADSLRAPSDALPARPGTPSHDIPLGSVAEALFKPVPFNDPKVALAMDVLGLGLAGAGAARAALPRNVAPEAPRGFVSNENFPGTLETAVTTDAPLGSPTIMRRTGLSGEQLRATAAQKEWELMKQKDVQWSKDNANLPLSESGPLPPKPLNPYAVQKLLGDMFALKEAPSPHTPPTIGVVEDLQNLAVWGKTKGPYRMPTPPHKMEGLPQAGDHIDRVPGNTAAESRQFITDEMADLSVGPRFQRMVRERANAEKAANATMRDAIMEEGNYFGAPDQVFLVLPQKLLRPNSGPTLNAIPADGSAVVQNSRRQRRKRS